jgi:phage portal protein BeeE
MGLIQNLRDATRKQKATKVTQEFANQLIINPLCSDYENVFAQVQPLINDMKMVRPFGVGRNGGRLPDQRTPELTVLYSPNEEMGYQEFAGTMFATWLTEDELNIHVHREGNRVIGYTILPPSTKQYLGNGNYQFQVNTEDGVITLTRDEVMTLRFSRSPRDIRRGVSPATAVRAWAQAEDVLAQYERAYIENGAIPASITIIRASSQDKFNSVRKELEHNLRGAKNHGKTIYVWSQFNNDTGESMDQVEVKTIQGNNSTLAIKELADIINDHLNKAYGVSNFILGDDSSAKYDNAELSDYQFIKRRVFPALTGFWDQFQHELDRIVGGLGYGIQFEIELPDLTERQKTRAEIAEIRSRTLKDMIQAGALPNDAIKALDLGSDWRGVARGMYNKALVEQYAMDEKQKDSYLPLKCKTNTEDASHANSTSNSSHQCTCSTSAHDELPPMTKDERQIYDALVAMAERIFANEPNIDAEGVIEQINEVLTKKATVGGQDSAGRVMKLLSDEAVVEEIKASIANLRISNTLKDRINKRTATLVDSYGQSTKELMNRVLANSKGLSANEIRKELRAVMPTWQAERIARTETVYAFKSGRLDEDKKLADKYNLKIKLKWRAREGACDVCAAMDGEETVVGTEFVDKKEYINAEGEKVVVSWDQDEWNDDGQIPEAHPNCRCYFDEIVEEA